MNKHNARSTLRLFILIAIALNLGCTQSTVTDSPISTLESFHPNGKIIYSTTHGIFSFEPQDKTTNTIFSTDKIQYDSIVVKESIYVRMGDQVSWDIYKVNLDGSNLEQLTFDGNVITFNVSPNGDYLAYSLSSNQLFVYDVRSQKSILAYEKNHFFFIVDSWSPDGSQFLFSERELVSENSLPPLHPLLLYTLENKSAIELLPAVGDFGFSSSPTWSPDKKHIALNMTTVSKSNGLGIYILDTETNSIQQVADGVVAFKLEWSPNGNMLIYESETYGDGTKPKKLNLFDLTSKETKIIYEGQTSWYSKPQLWAPDSNYFAYFTNISGSPWYLNIQDTNGGENQIFEVPPGISGATWIEK